MLCVCFPPYSLQLLGGTALGNYGVDTCLHKAARGGEETEQRERGERGTPIPIVYSVFVCVSVLCVLNAPSHFEHVYDVSISLVH